MKLPAIRLILWMILAWPLPALLAHALGWHAIWGSGSVGLDYLLPLPVAAGVVHVPSFVLCAIGLWQLPSLSAKAAGRIRAAAWGLVLAGLLGLLRLDEALLAWRSASLWSGTIWQENPLALFVLTDAGLALLISIGHSTSAPDRDRVRLALRLIPGLSVLGLAWQMAPSADAFLPGAVRPGTTRGDAQWMVFTAQNMQGAGFAQKATAWAQQWHRAGLGQGGDMAILFTDSRDASRRFQSERAQRTLCLFDDDAPPRWLPGAQAQLCFEGHMNFLEAVEMTLAAQAQQLPMEQRRAKAEQQVCAQRRIQNTTSRPYGPCASVASE
jgi:hypothetical protein